MPSASFPDDLAELQSALGRPIRFDEYVDAALYGAHGFYRTGGRAGRRGDFLTSPEVGPLFGAVIARWIDSEYQRLGSPDHFTVVEVGAGPGTLARSVLLASPHLTGHYVAVEIGEAQREQHPAGVESVDEFDVAGMQGVVIANELLDNLPFRLAVYDGGWREAFVRIERDGSIVEVLAPPPASWSWLPEGVPHGARVPIQDRAHEWVAATAGGLAAGSLLAFDYCTARTADVAAMPWREWLRTYKAHERGVHYLRDGGLQDVTTQVCVDQLPPADAVRTQAQFLQRWGIADLVEEGRQTWEARAASPDLSALRMRSRIREAETLLDPSGLGSFLALEWTARPEAAILDAE